MNYGRAVMIFKNKINFVFISVLLMIFNNAVVNAEEFDATLGWSKRVELSTPVSGMVQEVFALAGSIVAKGEVLVQLDPRAFKADLKYAKAEYKNADEQYQEAQRELDRQSDMYERTMLSEHDLQVAKNNAIAAKALFQKSAANLTKAKLNLEHSAIRAPFNAIVINSRAVKGQVVAVEITPPTLVIVAEAQRMLARFFASSDKLTQLTINQGVNVNVSGKIYQGKIFEVALEPEESKPNLYAVDVLFDSKDDMLRAGQNVKIDL